MFKLNELNQVYREVYEILSYGEVVTGRMTLIIRDGVICLDYCSLVSPHQSTLMSGKY